MDSSAVLSAGSPQPKLGTPGAPTFITTWSCPYAQRTWIALNEKRVKYAPVFVDLKSKPEWFFPFNPYGRVPTLVWEDRGGAQSLYESLICNEFVEEAFLGPSLLPDNPMQRAQVRLLIDQFGAKFSPAFGKVMFSAGGADADAAAKALDDAIAWLDGALDPEGPYACGREFSLADCAMAPFALRLSLLEPLCGYTPPEGAKRFAAWRDACVARPSVQASIAPPDASRGYMEQLLETYRDYVAQRRAAAQQ